jgi:pantetheine-phosphate adenylyltransferase/16S rRNA (guanine(966)-N(2))-methyltransferase RsmD
MRIIAGALKGRRPHTPKWQGLRPTSDKLRETLFNVVASRVPEARVLDAYAGTGAVGIEALSRGAAHVTFVDSDPRAVKLIGENLRRCGVSERYAIIRFRFGLPAVALGAEAGQVPQALSTGSFDLAVLDPPYDEVDLTAVVAACASPAGAGVGWWAESDACCDFRRQRLGVLYKSSHMKLAVYPGSFDPLTNGHVDIIERGTHLFDKIIVAILVNVEKSPLFSMQERVGIVREVFKGRPNVEVDTFDGLLVDYVARRKADVIVRGLRAVSDYETEFQMALMNRRLNPAIETVFMMPAEQYTYISSRLIKEVFSLGGRVRGLVPEIVETRLREKQLRPVR